jgi:hypothetical protein
MVVATGRFPPFPIDQSNSSRKTHLAKVKAEDAVKLSHFGLKVWLPSNNFHVKDAELICDGPELPSTCVCVLERGGEAQEGEEKS